MVRVTLPRWCAALLAAAALGSVRVALGRVDPDVVAFAAAASNTREAALVPDEPTPPPPLQPPPREMPPELRDAFTLGGTVAVEKFYVDDTLRGQGTHYR